MITRGHLFAAQTFADRLASAGFDERQACARAAVLARAAALLDKSGLSESNDLIAFLVPGRIEFLGKHTDYAGGRSLLCAVNRGFGIVAAPRDDGKVRIIEPHGANPVSFDLDPNLQPAGPEWSNYARTVARRIARNFPGELRGADIAFASDLPPSAGMSSSSALMIAVYLVLAKVNRLDDRPEYAAQIHSDEDLAGYLGTVENGQSFGALKGDLGVGTFGGSQDHTAILCSRPGVLRQYSFCPVRHERDVALPEGYTLAVCASGVVAEKTGAAREAYNAMSLSVGTLMKLWRDETGRDDATLADAVRSNTDARATFRRLLRSAESDAVSSARLIDRLEQFIAESEEIVPAAGDALRGGRVAELGALVDRSQDLSARLLRNQIPETIFLAAAARECGAAAASAFGAGFGGSVWAMVREAQAEKFLVDWRGQYARRFAAQAGRATFFLTPAARPAEEVI